MASQSPTAGPAGDQGRITFEVEQMGIDEPGRLMLTGRWFGVRGRRFVRPTLLIELRSDGSEIRSLADLDHKPWAAEDGEEWVAVFPVDVEMSDVASIELSVAPDIAVDLTPPKGGSKSAKTKPASAPEARAPRVRSEPDPVRRARRAAGERFQEFDRLKSRLVASERETERERTRREEADNARDEARAESLRLRSELGRLQAELDLAATAHGELTSTAEELDSVRRGAQNTERRFDAVSRALEHERSESARLRQKLASAEATVQRLIRSEETARLQADVAEPTLRLGEDDTQVIADTELDRDSDAERRRHRDSEEAARRERLSGPLHPPVSRAPGPSPEYGGHAHGHHPHHPLTDRPINPALRPGANWFVRVLALLVILAVIAAVIVVIHSTIA